MFRRHRAPDPPPRRPHPDPRIETRLQGILALRESAARKSALIGQYTTEVGNLSAVYRDRVGCHESRATGAEDRLKDLQAEIRQLEREIDGIHEDIAKRTDELSETDLSYL